MGMFGAFGGLLKGLAPPNLNPLNPKEGIPNLMNMNPMQQHNMANPSQAFAGARPGFFNSTPKFDNP